MNSSNEWGDLKKVVVGIADHAKIPPLDKSLRTVNYSNVLDNKDIPSSGFYPKQVIEETNEDLEKLVDELKKLKIEVLRPRNVPSPYYNYCPRDLVTVIGNTAIAAPMSLVSRAEEYKNIQHHLKNLIIAPNNINDENYNLSSIGNKEILALNELFPKFDAANIIRANEDILYLVSNSGNKKGAEYLQTILDKKYKIRILEKVYSYMHIDSTVAFLREGLLLLNPKRIKNKEVLPYPFNTWDAIYAPPPVDIGHFPGFCNASEWISINLLSITSNLVVLEEHQLNLAKELKKYKIESLLLPLRHSRTLGGCFHCVTLDVERT